MDDFSGSKLVLLIGSKLLTLLRDDIPDIPFPGYWDLPGGGREGTETAEDCALRETFEEFGLRLAASDLIWKQAFSSQLGPRHYSMFFGARLPARHEADIVFGDEGQEWRLVTPDWYLTHTKAVPHFVERVRIGVAALGVSR